MVKRAAPTRPVTCVDCETVFSRVGRGRCLRCPGCRKKNAAKRAWEYAVRKRRIRNPGVGSGGAQLGEANHRWGGGVAAYRRIGRDGKAFACETCAALLTRRLACVHHVDGNRGNNSSDNLKLVCKACHQNTEHERLRDKLGRYTSRSKTPE